MKSPRVLALCGDDPWTIRREIAQAVAEVPAEWHSMAVRRYWGEELPMGELLAEVMTPAFGAPLKVLIVERAQRVQDKNRLVEAVGAVTEGCRLILVQDEPKFTHKALEAALTKHGRIQKLYPPNAATTRQRLSSRLKEEGIEIEEDALAFLVPSLTEDPGAMEGEIEKIALFLADRPEDGRVLSLAMARELSGTHRDHDPFLFPRLFLERRRGPCMDALNHHLRLGEDLLSLSAILISEIWKTLVYVEGRENGLPEGEIWKRAVVFWRTGQDQIRAAADRATGSELRAALAGALELDQTMKRDSLYSEGSEGDRLHLSGFLQLSRLIAWYTRPGSPS